MKHCCWCNACCFFSKLCLEMWIHEKQHLYTRMQLRTTKSTLMRLITLSFISMVISEAAVCAVHFCHLLHRYTRLIMSDNIEETFCANRWWAQIVQCVCVCVPITKRLKKVKSHWRQYGWKTELAVDRMSWKWEFVWKRGRQKDSNRRGVTFESCTWIALQPRTFGRLKCPRTHIHTRANAPSLAAFVVAGTPWERPTGRQTFLSASHKRDPRTCVPAHTHTYKDAVKRYTVA